MDHPGPSVACVGGHAIAGGCVLAPCCDRSVATDSERARIGLTEVALGACFPPAILRLLRQRLPAGRREELLLDARPYAPREALRVGPVDEVAADPFAVARERPAELARHPARAYAPAKGSHLGRLLGVLVRPRRTGAYPLRRGATDVGPEDGRRFVEEELAVRGSDELRRRIRGVLEGRR